MFFEFFPGNFGGGPFGSFLVIFEYFRVRGICVSLTGALNRNPSVQTGGKDVSAPNLPRRSKQYHSILTSLNLK